MLLNYVALALRNLQRNATFSLINALGLCLGMTAYILISQYVFFEKSYNTFHADLPVLYRTLIEMPDGKVDAFTAPGFAPLAANQISGIEQFCRLAEGATLGTGIVSFENASLKDKTAFRENRFVYADGNFFSVFSFPVITGNPAALAKPNAVALSRSTSIKYFGDASAVGKVLTLNNQFGRTLYTVEVVYDDMPDNSDLRYDLVFSLQTLASASNLNGNEMWANLDGTGSQWLFTYVKLKPEADAEAVAGHFTQLIQKINPQETAAVKLQRVADMHLGASLTEALPAFGSLKFIYLLAGIAALILVIAWFNYVNLSTAGALKRAKEVGIRKAVGASRQQLVRQFLGESAILHALALGISLALVSAVQIPYAALTGKNMSAQVFNDAGFWSNVAFVLLVGFAVSGAYTGFVLSSFNPSKVLKGVFSKSVAGVTIRKTLVVVQFSISLTLIVTTIILFQQWRYMENKELGLNAGQLVVIRGAQVTRDDTFRQRSEAFENDVRNTAFVEEFTRSGSVPMEGFNFTTSGITRLNPSEGEEKINYDMLTIDDRYLKTYSISLSAGENFTSEMCSRSWNEMEYLILNERAADLMGFHTPDEAVGQKVKWGERVFEVRGVTKNYHHLPVQSAVGPIVFLPSSQGEWYTLRLASDDFANHLAVLETSYKQNFPGNPFEYQFLDDTFAAKYAAERRYSIIFTVASLLAVFIGCLGLFGLAMYSIEQRRKEIGVRKVLGSSALHIVNLLSRDFIKLVGMAFILTTPLSWWLMEHWLAGFPYRITISWWVFAVAGLGLGIVAWLTVSVQAFKSAAAHPVAALRSE